MRSGYWVVATFATGWASAGLLVAGYPPAAVLVPLAISAAVLIWAYRLPSTARDTGAHVRKIIGRWSLIEGAAFVVAVNVLRHLHRPDLLFPVAAIIVGLHFLPLARGIPVRIYHATGVGLVATGLAGLALPASERPLAVGISAAMILWATAVYRLVDSRRMLAA